MGIGIPPYGLPPLPGQSGNSGKYLTTNGSSASWGTVAGGQTTYDAVVIAGGTYTTLGAAIAAASNGWRILVFDSTTETGNITSSLTGLTIVGAGIATSVGMTTSYALTLSGINLTMQNLTISTPGDTAKLTFSGDNALIIGCKFDEGSSTPGTAVGPRITFSGANARWYDSEVTTTSTTSSGNTATVYAQGNGFQMVGCHIKTPFTCTSAGTVDVDSLPATITGNYFECTGNSAAQSDANMLRIGGGFSSVTGNTFQSAGTVSVRAIILSSTYNECTGNMVRTGVTGIYISSSGNNVTGNTITLTETASSNAIYVGSGNTIVSDNLIRTSDAVKAGVGIFINSTIDDCNITNNRVQGFATGILVNASSCDNNNIVGNKLFDNTTMITDSGTGTQLADNYGADANNAKTQLLMVNTSGGTIAAGAIVVLKAVAAGNEVTTTTTASDNATFGVASAAINSTASGYIQTSGKTTLLKVNGTTDIAIGDFITTYTSAGIGAKAAAGNIVIAYALEAYTGNDDNGVIDALILKPFQMA